ncbi:MAG: phage virion morphogenesis protein [Rhodocyclaceae bacterium]|nr:phage virion morphogenesis protein [Rhodocyclaceae bacterium]
MTTHIELDDEAVNAVLGRLVELGADTSMATRPISEDLMAAVEDKFARELGPEGPWQDLADSTKKAREKRGTWPGKKLQETTRLLSSIQPFYDASEAVVGTNVIYAMIQNWGGQAGRNHATTIPAREYFWLSDEDWQRIFESAESVLDRVIAGAA